MEQIQGIIEGIKEKIKENEQKPKNIGERHIIVGEIYQKLKVHSYKKISMPFLGKLLSIYSTPQLYELHSACKQAKNYAGLFWSFLKIK